MEITYYFNGERYDFCISKEQYQIVAKSMLSKRMKVNISNKTLCYLVDLIWYNDDTRQEFYEDNITEFNEYFEEQAFEEYMIIKRVGGTE